MNTSSSSCPRAVPVQQQRLSKTRMAPKAMAPPVLFVAIYVWLATFCVATEDDGGVSSAAAAEEAEKRQTYVVHVATWKKPTAFATRQAWYQTLVNGSVIYSYDAVADGFAARLTPRQADQLQRSHGVLSLHPQCVFDLHTTRSPDFMSLTRPQSAGLDVWDVSEQGRGVIVGIVDTGVWPSSPSFSDAGMDPPPRRWKGACDGRDLGFTCNNKLIGARFFSDGIDDTVDLSNAVMSPLDTEGHGTHTASTAAGAFVPSASFYGFANGTARGMAPRAWIAVYKACWFSRCHGTDILAAIDAAISDGVDIVSLSLGGSSMPYYAESVNVASFGAVSKGVLVVASAGNSGPDPATVSNVAPWITTVAAGSLDRDFTAAAVTGDGRRYLGSSLFAGPASERPRNAALVYIPDAAQCRNGTLEPATAAGKVVLCDRGGSPRVEKGAVVKEAGGVGMIMVNVDPSDDDVSADMHLLPAVNLNYADGVAIKNYIRSAGARATATIEEPRTVLGLKPAPTVARFSSRGPNVITPEILKPDVMAPGVNILAGWSNASAPSKASADKRKVRYNILSGTSMSCPHVAGIAALLKAEHPEWSPAAIRSALMTTANPNGNDRLAIVDKNTSRPASPYARGAGHVMPHRAIYPGLIYDITPEDYMRFICSLNYTKEQVRSIVRTDLSCNRVKRLESPGDLNYPSFSVVFTPTRRKFTFKRTVTNVGSARSVYRVRVFVPQVVKVTVEPQVLTFSRTGQQRSYQVTFELVNHSTSSSSSFYDTDMDGQAELFGSLVWTNRKIAVRSPMAFTSQPYDD